MASKVSAGVSYGIGVQNRYSAFLEDEDGILLPPASMKRANETQTSAGSKQKGSNSAQKPAPKQLNGKHETSSNSSNKKTIEAQQSKNPMNGQQARQVDVRRGQQQHQQRNDKAHGVAGVRSAQASRQNYATGKGGNQESVQAGGDANQKYHNHRNPMNRNFSHPSNASHQHNNSNNNSHNNSNNNNSNNNSNVNKENDSSPGFNSRASNSNNNQRFNRQRQYQSRDERRGPPTAGADGQLNSHAAPISEEEKRRRQQKRALDLKFKDPEKGAARRQQAAANGVGGGDVNELGANAEADENGQRGMRNKRPGGRPDEAVAGRNMRGPGGFRGPRSQEGGAASGGGNDRPQRSRNGFGNGSRNSNQGSRGDTRNQERARPIPNFSDKSDFPSLAS